MDDIGSRPELKDSDRNPKLGVEPGLSGPGLSGPGLDASGGGVVGGSPPGPPEVRLGRYHLLRAIGRGGMGQVFEAWDGQLQRRVALKVLAGVFAGDGDEQALREARCLARLSHPNVVGVHDVGCADELVFIAMELVDGPDLRRWLCERSRRWTDVLDRLISAAHGLAAVHRAGLVHGDVKPGNVLIGADNRVRIADFGLARVRTRASSPALHDLVRRAAEAVDAELDGLASPAGLASPVGAGQSPRQVPEPRRRGPEPRAEGAALPSWFDAPPPGGTQAYMAPECFVAHGEASDPEDGHCAADQWSFCVMAWEALFGVRPFEGRDGVAMLGAIAAGRLQRGRGRPRGMPARVEAVLRRGLSELPSQRWPSIAVLISELERARRSWRRVWGVLVGAVVVTAVVGTFVASSARPRPSMQTLVEAARCPPCSTESLRLARLGPGVLGPGVLAWAELSLIAAGVDPAPATPVILDHLDRAMLRLEQAGTHEHLRAELLLARGRLHDGAGRLEWALEDTQRALELDRSDALPPAVRVSAFAQLARISARSGRCQITRTALERMRASGRDEPPVARQLDWVVDVLQAIESPVSPECATALREAWTLASKLSRQGVVSSEAELTREYPRRSR